MGATDHARRFLRRHRMLAEIGAQLAAALASVLRFIDPRPCGGLFRFLLLRRPADCRPDVFSLCLAENKGEEKIARQRGSKWLEAWA
jgi:hypothetical protein